MKKILFLLTVALAVSAFAGDTSENFSQIEDAGANSKHILQGTISSWKWVLALLPIASAFWMTNKLKEYQEQQEESGQYQPKVQKMGMLLAAFAGTIVIFYLLYGLLGAVFTDKSFADMWKSLVVDFFSSVF